MSEWFGKLSNHAERDPYLMSFLLFFARLLFHLLLWKDLTDIITVLQEVDDGVEAADLGEVLHEVG